MSACTAVSHLLSDRHIERRGAVAAFLVTLASCGDNIRPDLRTLAEGAGAEICIDENAYVLTGGGPLLGVWRLGDSDAWEWVPNTSELRSWGLGNDLDGAALLLAAPDPPGDPFGQLYRIADGRLDPIGGVLWLPGSHPVAGPSGQYYASVQGAPYRLVAVWAPAPDLGQVSIESSIAGLDGTLFLVGTPGIVWMAAVGGDDVAMTVLPSERLPLGMRSVVLSGVDASGTLYFAQGNAVYALEADTVTLVAVAHEYGHIALARTTSTGATIVLAEVDEPEKARLLYRAQGSDSFEEVDGETLPPPNVTDHLDSLVLAHPDRIIVHRGDWLGEIVIPHR